MDIEKMVGTITTTIVTDKSKKYCYEIERTLDEQKGEKAIVLGLYPTLGNSKEDIYDVDMTTKHLISHMPEMNLNEVRMVNLFSKITHSRMSTRGLECDTDNISYLEEIMKSKEMKDYKVILAYGSSMAKSKACNETKTKLLRLYKKYVPDGKLYQITTDNMELKNEIAPHILYMGIRYNNAKWRLEEIKSIKNIVVDNETKKQPAIIMTPKKGR